MCMQCMVTAMTSVAAASGTRSWLAQKRADWLTPKRLRYITIGLCVLAVIASGLLSGSS
jgi:hypothetical protein